MVDRLRKKFDEISGARIKLVLFQNGAPINAPVEFRVYGPDQDELKRVAAKMELALRETPGARDINNPVAFDRIDLDIRVDDAKAALLEVPAGAARRAVRLAISGERAGTFRDEEGDSYPIIVRHPLIDTQPISALESIYVSNRSGQAVSLAEISNPTLESTPAAIYRYNLQRNVSVTAQVSDGAVISKVNLDAQKKMDAIPLKPGYSIAVGGEAEKINETFAGFGPVVIVALFSIFAILVAEFGRFKEALVVAGVIPLGTFGGLIALLVTGNNLSFLAVIGFIALIGIEIKNSILLVDFTSQLRASGYALREAIEKAGEVRFLPVLLTSVTAIGGLMPLALFGGSLYGPLAIVLIGGLISSTVLSRIVTPAMYLLVVRGDVVKAPDSTQA
jgi:multidrug efflux pump subunit AcrB